MYIDSSNPGVVRGDAPAKINLFLEVRNRRPDGYHEINSLFQAVSLTDRVSVSNSSGRGVRCTVIGDGNLSAGDDNLVVRACRLMLDEFRPDGGVDVVLEKHIPVATGLGGGSSEAAAGIEACNVLFGLGLTQQQRMQLGLRLGSDVPFFFTRGQALIRGRGEVMEETAYPTDYQLVLVNPGFPVSTPAAYAALKRGLTVPGEPFTLPCCRTVEEYVFHLGHAENDFEPVHRRTLPELGEIAAELLRRGAALARLSGSGPTVFGLFTDRSAAQTLVEAGWGHWRIFAAAPLPLPVEAT